VLRWQPEPNMRVLTSATRRPGQKAALRMALALAALLTGSRSVAAEAQESQLEPRKLPEKVSIAIVNATVGPVKFGNKSWDCCAKVPADMGVRVAKLLLATVAPQEELAALVAAPFLAGEAAPDPFGWADVAINGEYVPRLRHSFFPPGQCKRNTFTPIFPSFEWRDIPLDAGTRIKVTLFDKDLVKNDDIGVAEINHADLVAALRAQKIYQVKVAEQTQNQLLFVGISVRARTQ
jgi:hypothetical protein